MDSSCLVPGLINCYIWRGMHNGWYFSGQQFCGVWWNSTPTKTRLVKTKESMSIPILTHTQQARKPQIEHSDGHYEEKICKKKNVFLGGPMPKCRKTSDLWIAPKLGPAAWTLNWNSPEKSKVLTSSPGGWYLCINLSCYCSTRWGTLVTQIDLQLASRSLLVGIGIKK